MKKLSTRDWRSQVSLKSRLVRLNLGLDLCLAWTWLGSSLATWLVCETWDLLVTYTTMTHTNHSSDLINGLNVHLWQLLTAYFYMLWQIMTEFSIGFPPLCVFETSLPSLTPSLPLSRSYIRWNENTHTVQTVSTLTITATSQRRHKSLLLRQGRLNTVAPSLYVWCYGVGGDCSGSNLHFLFLMVVERHWPASSRGRWFSEHKG